MTPSFQLANLHRARAPSPTFPLHFQPPPAFSACNRLSQLALRDVSTFSAQLEMPSVESHVICRADRYVTFPKSRESGVSRADTDRWERNLVVFVLVFVLILVLILVLVLVLESDQPAESMLGERGHRLVRRTLRPHSVVYTISTHFSLVSSRNSRRHRHLRLVDSPGRFLSTCAREKPLFSRAVCVPPETTCKNRGSAVNHAMFYATPDRRFRAPHRRLRGARRPAAGRRARHSNEAQHRER